MKATVILLFLFASVAAHSTWQQIWINGVDGGTSCARMAANNNPISVNSQQLACNQATNSPNVCTIKPGDKVTVEMHGHVQQRSCRNEAMGGNHYGPILIYMAAVSDAKTANAASANWFKIHHMGMVSNNPVYWAVQVLNDNCGHYTFTVPDVAPGNYLLRAEAIALHVASGSGGAQFYPGCWQVNVIGQGTARPPTVRIPGAYSANDPGILININSANLKNYIIPGPEPYGYRAPPIATTKWPTTATWNTNNQPSNVPTVTPPVVVDQPQPPPLVTQPPPPVVTPPPPAVTPPPPAIVPSQPPAALQTRFGQCGGSGWNGPTQCVAPYACQVSNQWYSQCA